MARRTRDLGTRGDHGVAISSRRGEKVRDVAMDTDEAPYEPNTATNLETHNVANERRPPIFSREKLLRKFSSLLDAFSLPVLCNRRRRPSGPQSVGADGP